MEERSRQGRVPPHSLDAERAVLGGVLLQNNVIDTINFLVGADFYSQGNGSIFDAMLKLHEAGQPVDTVTLRDALDTRNKLQACGGDEYLLSLTDTLPTVENIKEHALIVQQKAQVRRMIDTAHEIAAKGYGDYGDFRDYLDVCEKSIFDVAKVQARQESEHIKDVVMRTFKAIHELAKSGERVAGLPSGFTRLDQMTAGMHPGDLIIVAGRPGMGKTSFALNMAVNACSDKRCGIAVFSLEMPRDQLAKRMLCSEARVDANRMRTGTLQRDDWPRLANAAGVLSELPIFIDDTAGLTIMDLNSKARRLHAEHGLGLIVIDYLQLMRAVGIESREQQISEISRSLKSLAKELGIPVIALSQLNRGVEARGNKDKRPQLSDLRESGAIEQDADTIYFIYRDEVYNKETLDQGVAEIIIGKQRAGPTGSVRCRFFKEYTRFDNLADGELEGGDFEG